MQAFQTNKQNDYILATFRRAFESSIRILQIKKLNAFEHDTSSIDQKTS